MCLSFLERVLTFIHSRTLGALALLALWRRFGGAALSGRLYHSVRSDATVAALRPSTSDMATG